MNLQELVTAVNARTCVAESLIEDIVRLAWPNHKEFTPTQAALVVHRILQTRNEPTAVPNEGPRTITDEQLWGKQ